MNISVLQENLIKATTRVGKIINPKSPMPILQNILLSARDGVFEIASTNLESTESVRVRAKVESDGEICVPARTLTDLIASFPQGTVHLTLDKDVLRVKCNGFSASIPTMAPGEFPPRATLSQKKATLVSKEAFSAALTRVLFTAAVDEGRPLLTGVRIESGEEETSFVATDGYRLSVQKAGIVIKSLSAPIVVPARVLSEVMKIAVEEKDEESFSLTLLTEGQLGFAVGQTEIVTRLISGDYPSYQKIIPTTHSTRVLLDREHMYQAVKAAAIFAKDGANVIKLTLDKQRVVVSANTPSVGEGSIEVEAKIDGDGGEIAFNSRFVLEFLANFPDNEFLFEMTGSLNPGVFRLTKDQSYLHIIMPVRLQD